MITLSLSLFLLSLTANVYLYMQLRETKSQLRIEKWQTSILVDSFDKYIKTKQREVDDSKAAQNITAAN